MVRGPKAAASGEEGVPEMLGMQKLGLGKHERSLDERPGGLLQAWLSTSQRDVVEHSFGVYGCLWFSFVRANLQSFRKVPCPPPLLVSLVFLKASSPLLSVCLGSIQWG